MPDASLSSLDRWRLLSDNLPSAAGLSRSCSLMIRRLHAYADKAGLPIVCRCEAMCSGWQGRRARRCSCTVCTLHADESCLKHRRLLMHLNCLARVCYGRTAIAGGYTPPV